MTAGWLARQEPATRAVVRARADLAPIPPLGGQSDDSPVARALHVPWARRTDVLSQPVARCRDPRSPAHCVRPGRGGGKADRPALIDALTPCSRLSLPPTSRIRYVLHPDRSHGRLRRARSGGSVCVRTPSDAELSASLSGLLICRGEQSLAACVDSPRMGPAAPVAGSSGPRWRPDTSWAWPAMLDRSPRRPARRRSTGPERRP
jgi:hypothetical protein